MAAGALATAQAIAAGRLSAAAALGAALERIQARDPVVGAWQYLDGAAAMAHAHALDRGPSRGLLHGVPIGVKDIIDTADAPTGYGSPIYSGHRPAWDASAVALVRAAGAVLPGKTVSTEFAYRHPGRTANPRNPAHTPGGSSSGSAAAVADGQVPLAFGTQTGGSVARPAAYCGCVGFKPTFGAFSLAGVKTFAHSLDTLGWFAANVADAALLRAALHGERRFDAATRLAAPAPRLGVWRWAEWDRAAPETVAAVEAACRTLARAGARVAEARGSAGFEALDGAQQRVMAYEGARALAFEWQHHRDRLSAPLRALIEAGYAASPADHAACFAARDAWRPRLNYAFAAFDALIMPAGDEAPRGLAATGGSGFVRSWTLLGCPVVVLPFGTGAAGLPLAVQVVGAPGDDDRLLATAAWIEARLGA